jgi:hypothetical protein
MECYEIFARGRSFHVDHRQLLASGEQFIRRATHTINAVVKNRVANDCAARHEGKL